MHPKPDYEAALIEAQQEAGIDGKVGDVALGAYRYIKLFNDGRAAEAQALVYPVQVTAQLDKWNEQNQRSRRWVSLKKSVELAFEPDLKRFLTDLREETLVMHAEASQKFSKTKA